MANNNNPNPDIESKEQALTERQLKERVATLDSMNDTRGYVARSYNTSTQSIAAVSGDRDAFLRSSQNQELGQKNDSYFAYVISKPRELNDIEKVFENLKSESAQYFRYVSITADKSKTQALPSLEKYEKSSPQRTILNNIAVEALYDTRIFDNIEYGSIVRIQFADNKNQLNPFIIEKTDVSGLAMIANSSNVTKNTPLSEIRNKFFIGENPRQDIFDRRGSKRDLKNITEFIIHETTNFSSASTARDLLRKGLGVHYLISENGVIQPTGAWDRILGHASPHNPKSLGVEVVAPFYAEYEKKFAKSVGPYWKNVTNYAPWAHVRPIDKGNTQQITGYIFPTQKQMEATWELTQKVTSAEEINIPMKFLGFEKENNRFVVTGIKKYSKAKGPGIYAHSYFAHSDGAVLVLYCFLRYNGKNPQEAYQSCIFLLKQGNLKYFGNNYYADLSLLGGTFNV